MTGQQQRSGFGRASTHPAWSCQVHWVWVFLCFYTRFSTCLKAGSRKKHRKAHRICGASLLESSPAGLEDAQHFEQMQEMQKAGSEDDWKVMPHSTSWIGCIETLRKWYWDSNHMYTENHSFSCNTTETLRKCNTGIHGSIDPMFPLLTQNGDVLV